MGESDVSPLFFKGFGGPARSSSDLVRQDRQFVCAGLASLANLARVQFQKPKFQKKFPAPAWRLKSRRKKKRIATAVCKWRDESNEPN